MESQDQKYQSCVQTKHKSDSAIQVSIYKSLSDAINSADLLEPGSIVFTQSEDQYTCYMTADDHFVPLQASTTYQDTHTLKNMPECPSCGARSYVKTDDGYRCEYCGNLVCI